MAENTTESYHFSNSFTFVEIVVFDRIFSLIYFAPQTIIFGNMSS